MSEFDLICNVVPMCTFALCRDRFLRTASCPYAGCGICERWAWMKARLAELPIKTQA